MIVGTAGHIDHGKTALVRALTGVETDRLAEEKRRGITIDLGFAYLPAPDGSVLGFVDVPGHERFVPTMLAGAGGIDLVLLAVAADDGMMPQTREHLAILDLLGVGRGLVALTKSDLADAPRRAAVSDEIAAALDGTALAGADILPVSTVTGEGVAALRDRLFAEAAAGAARPGEDGRFRLAVDRCFTLAGTGTVVTGTVLSGSVAPGDRVVVSPGGLPARVRSVHAQNRPAERGRAGERCALNLAGEGVGVEAIRRGDVVLDPGLHAPTDRLDATLRLLPDAGEVGTWFPVRLHHAALDLAARVVPLGDGSPPPGRAAPVQLVLERPIAAAAGDRFVIRDTSAQRTLGGGLILDLRPPARKRRGPDRLALLAALAGDREVAPLRHCERSEATQEGRARPLGCFVADAPRNDGGASFEAPLRGAPQDEGGGGEAPGAREASAILAAPPGFLDLGAFARDRALAADAPGRLAAALGLTTVRSGDATLAVTADTWAAFGREIAERLDAFHAESPDLQGIGLERLRLVTALRLPAPAFRAALARLAEEGVARLAGSFVRRPGHEVRLGPAEEALWERIAPLLAGDERFRPPRVRDLAGLLAADEAEIRRLLKRTARQGRADEVAHDHFFLRGTVAEMSAIVSDLSAAAPDGIFTAALFRDRVQNGRKVAIQILDFFDRHGVTLRRGDLRRANHHWLDLFAPE